MATNTTTYNFLLPTVGGDTNLWGGYLNSNWSDIDDLLDGTAPVSGINIDGGSIDGTPVGLTAASTGAFTDLSITASFDAGGVALSNLANGVAATDATTLQQVNAAIAAVPSGLEYTKQTTTYTAVAPEGVIADTSGGAWTLTLPATPTSGDIVTVVDGANWAVNNLTVGRNGSTIEGVAADRTLSVGGLSVGFIYDGTTWQVYTSLTGVLPLTGGTLTGKLTVLDIGETVFALTGTTPALDPTNGTIQTWTLSANSTPTDSLVAGESLLLMVNDGTAFTITWPSVVWVGGTAPTLATTGFTVVTLWKVGSTLYGSLAGDVA